MVYDIWFHSISYHEIMSKWFRFLTENFEFIGDKDYNKDYKGCKYVKVCENEQEKNKKQIIEAMNFQIKNFNLISRWRKIKTFVAYLYAYAIGYSFLEKVNYEGNFSPNIPDEKLGKSKRFFAGWRMTLFESSSSFRGLWSEEFHFKFHKNS